MPKHAEHPFPFLEDTLTRFFIWALLTEIHVEADPVVKASVDAYLAQGHNQIGISAHEHTGHSDVPIMWQAIKYLFPGQEKNILTLVAKDNFFNPFKRLFIQLIAGEVFLFDRGAENGSPSSESLRDLYARIKNTEENIGVSPLIFPKGTRTLGAEIFYFPVKVARFHKIPIAVFNITGAETVFPKLPKGQQFGQIVEKIKDLARAGRKHEIEHHVTVKLTGFVTHEGNRQDVEARFLAAHGIQSRKHAQQQLEATTELP